MITKQPNVKKDHYGCLTKAQQDEGWEIDCDNELSRSDGWDLPIKYLNIKYCPMCGEDLKKPEYKK